MLKRLKDFSLFQQLIIPMLIVGALSASATIYSAFILHDSVSALGALHTGGDAQLRTIEELETSIAHFRGLTHQHIASENAFRMSELEVELDYTSSQISTLLANLSNLPEEQTQERQETLQELQQTLNNYLAGNQDIRYLSSDFEKEAAFEMITQVENRLTPIINTSLQRLKRQEFENFSSLRDSLFSATNRNLFVTITIGISGGSMALLIAYLVIKRITQRLYQLLSWSKMVAAGDLEAELVSDSGDEVGRLTRSMKDMAEDISAAQHALGDQKQRAETTAEELKIYANAFENSGESMVITDRNNHIINVNAAFTRQSGYTLAEVVGKDPKLMSSGQTPRATFQEMWHALETKSFWQGEMWDRKKNGEIFPKWIAISAIRDSADKILFYIASYSDISERKAAEAKIEHLAHHDILTGLHNRFNLETHLHQSLATAHREKQKLAVLFIDLDRFKTINDSLGHQVGDQLLIQVAERLKECVRDSDIVARIGGDEFVIVLPRLQHNSQVAVVAEKIIQNVSQPFEIVKQELIITPSIGISMYPSDGDNVDDLLKAADTAMYHSKEEGRNTYHYFTESMSIAANERLQTERELRNALQNEQLELHYQPVIRSTDMAVVSLEALLRWRHPVKGLISPDRFIPIAEEMGLIHEIGEWVVTHVCQQLQRWKSEGLKCRRVAINLSARQLQAETLAKDISAIMSRYKVKGDLLCLEVTETAAMHDPDKAVRQLHALRSLDINLSIDDFGKGYSSLAYLKRLPIDTLKLDKSFVRDIETDPNDAAICAATISLAHGLGLSIVAEGVETDVQRRFLMERGCDFMQGYIFSKPVPELEVPSFLQQPSESCQYNEIIT